MSVAAGIEIVTGGLSEPSLNQAAPNAADRAQGAGWAGAQAVDSSSASASGAQSFRSSWQSMLASLGAGGNRLGEEEGGADIAPPSAVPALDAAQVASPGTSLLLSGAALSLQPGRAPHGPPAASATILTLATSDWQTASGTRMQAAHNPAAKSQASARSEESALSAHSANSGRSAKREAVSGATAAALAPATAAGLQPAIFEPTTANPVAKIAEASARTQPTGLAGESPAGFTRDSVNRHSVHADGSGATAGRMSSVGNQAPAADQTAPLAVVRNPSPGEDPGGIEPSAAGRAESLAGGERALPPEVPPQVVEPLQPHTPGQNQAQPGNQGLGAAVPPIASGDASWESADSEARASQPGKSTAVAPIAGESSLPGSGRSSTQAALRRAHGAVEGAAVERGYRPLTGQPAGVLADGSNLAREPAGARAAMGAANDTAGSSAGATAGQATREIFAALDAENAPGTPSWTLAGAHRAEAGFQDPALGWVGVRADLGVGGIHASLVPGSADAAQALGSHLAGLNSYLAEQHTPVETLTLAAPGGRWTGPDGNQGTSQGMDQNGGRNADQGTFAEPQSNPPPTSPDLAATASSQLPASTGRQGTDLPAPRPGGIHISLMA
jgi:hypothetical protein